MAIINQLDFRPFDGYIDAMTDEAKKQDIIPPISSPSSQTKRPDFEMNTTPPDSNKVMWAASAIILVAAIAGGVIAITPKVKDVAAQKERIAGLEAELAAAKQKELAQAQTSAQLDEVKNSVTVLTDQARQLQSSLTSTAVQDKLAALEGKFDAVVGQSRAANLTGMIGRIQQLQQTPEGAAIIDKIVNSLVSADTGDVGQTFENLRSTDGQIAEVTEGVAPEDMKAAAMLIAMAQMRQSLQRSNDSFDTDLALLKKTIPADNTALNEAIDRLAPQAKFGVLTPSGLSHELRGMTGEIVSASLAGQDVSIQEKAKARLGNVFLVEKNGQRISGTQSQIAVAAAQKRLDSGDIEGAIEILKTLDGPAAEKSQPFIEKAQATLMAGNLQSILNQNIIQSVKTGISGAVHGTAPGIVNPYSLKSMTTKIQNALPVSPVGHQ